MSNVGLVKLERYPLLEYPEAVRACAMRRYPRNFGTYISLFF